jgi:hypothetical protein
MTIISSNKNLVVSVNDKTKIMNKRFLAQQLLNLLISAIFLEVKELKWDY